MNLIISNKFGSNLVSHSLQA